MAFIKKEEKRGLSLPGLIDIIFLLLIFCLGTLTTSEPRIDEEGGSEGEVDLNLPETNIQKTYDVDEVLQTLLLQVDLTDPNDRSSPRRITILWPSLEDSLTIEEAKRNAMRDSLFSVFPPDVLNLSDEDFSRIPPCTLIHWGLETYKKEYFQESKSSNTIEIRAVRDTEFRIINYILEQCSVYGDTIPRLTLRTMSRQEGRRGF